MKRQSTILRAMLAAVMSITTITSCIDEAPERPETTSYTIGGQTIDNSNTNNNNNNNNNLSTDGTETLSFGLWWTNWSQNYTLKENQRMTVTIDNFTSQRLDFFDNWAFFATSAGWTERNGAGYTEYFVVRADGGTWTSTKVTTDGTMAAADEAYIDFMQDGTKWTIIADHNPGQLSVHTEAVNPAGQTFVMDAVGSVPTGADLWVFFTGEQSSYIISSVKYENLGDANPISIEVTGLRSYIESGAVEYTDGSSFKVIATFEGNVTKDVTSDVIISVADNSTVGETDITVTFAMTLQGNVAEPISYTTKINVINPIKSLTIKTPPTKTEYGWQLGQKGFEPEGMTVIGVAGDESETEIDLKDLTFSDITGEGEQTITISYGSGDNIVSTTTKINVEKYTPLSGIVGLEDRTSAWWTYFLLDNDGIPYGIEVPEGETATISFHCYPGAYNHFNFYFFVRQDVVTPSSDDQFNSIVNCRADNWWWAGTGSVTEKGCNNLNEEDWINWKSDIDGARVVATFTHKIDGTSHYLDIDIKFYCTNGKIYPQYYHDIELTNPSNTRTYVSVEQSYIDFD